MAIVFAIPGYLSEGNVSAILQASAILIVLTIGQTFVIATGGIDLSVASNMTLGASSSVSSSPPGGDRDRVLACGSSARPWAGQRPADLQGRITDFIVTLGTLSAASGLALIIADGKQIEVDRSMLDLRDVGRHCFSW